MLLPMLRASRLISGLSENKCSLSSPIAAARPVRWARTIAARTRRAILRALRALIEDRSSTKDVFATVHRSD